MASDKDTLIASLRSAGISKAAIAAAWPSWWSEEVDRSPSGRAELRFTLSRRLGLSAKPLLGERVEFVWNDEARFKNLKAGSEPDRAALTSYGVVIGRLLLRAVRKDKDIQSRNPYQLRDAILATHKYVDFHSLITTCWALGIPVVHLRVFPLETKSMHAMVVTVEGRCAILLGRDASYPAPVAFTLAHELGHIMLRHLEGAVALVDMEDAAAAIGSDPQELEADAFALTLLTGSAEPVIQTNVSVFNAQTLAKAVLDAGPIHRVEPGTLALCLAYQRNAWPTAMAALRYIYTTSKPAWQEVNGIANNELDWDSLGADSVQYLKNVMSG